MMWLYKVAYPGWKFNGSQIQPDVRTVEGEIERVVGGRCALMSRTDAGVSAKGNILVIDKKLKVDRINAQFKDAVIWARAEVEKVPKVKHRHYRYFLVDGRDPGYLKKFDGTHDFADYTKAKTDTVRDVKVKLSDSGDVGYVDFFSRGFLWNQVRRMVGNGKTDSPGPLVLVDIIFENAPTWTFFTRWLEMLKKEQLTHMAKALTLNTMID